MIDIERHNKDDHRWLADAADINAYSYYQFKMQNKHIYDIMSPLGLFGLRGLAAPLGLGGLPINVGQL